MLDFPGKLATHTRALGPSGTKAKGGIGQGRQGKGTSPPPRAAGAAPHPGIRLARAGKVQLS